MMYYVRCPDGSRWRVYSAKSLKGALSEIAMAKVTGSVGGATYHGHAEFPTTHVHRVNDDNTDRQPGGYCEHTQR